MNIFDQYLLLLPYILYKKCYTISTYQAWGQLSDIQFCASYWTVKKLWSRECWNFSCLSPWILKPLLERYQADEPFVVYRASDLTTLFISHMELFIKPKVIQENHTSYRIANLDDVNISNADIQLPERKIGADNEAKLALTSASPKLNELSKLQFMMEYITVLVPWSAKFSKYVIWNNLLLGLCWLLTLDNPASIPRICVKHFKT